MRDPFNAFSAMEAWRVSKFGFSARGPLQHFARVRPFLPSAVSIRPAMIEKTSAFRESWKAQRPFAWHRLLSLVSACFLVERPKPMHRKYRCPLRELRVSFRANSSAPRHISSRDRRRIMERLRLAFSFPALARGRSIISNPFSFCFSALPRSGPGGPCSNRTVAAALGSRETAWICLREPQMFLYRPPSRSVFPAGRAPGPRAPQAPCDSLGK